MLGLNLILGNHIFEPILMAGVAKQANLYCCGLRQEKGRLLSNMSNFYRVEK